jgi:DNA-binding MarR family transcriptional regulator
VKSTSAAKTGNGADRAPLTVGRGELLVNGSDREFRRLVNALFPLLALHTSVRNGYAELLGLTGPAYSILLSIRTLNDNGPVNVRTIADQLRFSGSFITAETNALERKGFVKKRRSVEDKRVVTVSLTPRAIALLDSIASLRRQVNDVQFGCLSQKEFLMLVPMVERLVQSSERAVALLEYWKKHPISRDESELSAAAIYERV